MSRACYREPCLERLVISQGGLFQPLLLSFRRYFKEALTAAADSVYIHWKRLDLQGRLPNHKEREGQGIDITLSPNPQS